MTVKKGRKGQVWIADLTISLILFSAAAIIAFNIIINSFASNTDYDAMKEDATKISEYLLAEGIPEDWNSTTLVRPGLATGNRLNGSKVYLAMNMTDSSAGYEAMKPFLQTNYDFLVVFEDYEGDLVDFTDYCAFGNPDVTIEGNMTPPVNCSSVNLTSISYDNMVVLNRFTVYGSDIVRMVVYVWN